MFHLLKSRTSIDIFRGEKCKVTFGLKYSLFTAIPLTYVSPVFENCKILLKFQEIQKN